jgi:hypothetical protein
MYVRWRFRTRISTQNCVGNRPFLIVFALSKGDGQGGQRARAYHS